MKKLLCLIAVICVVCLSLVACHESKEQQERRQKRDAAYLSGDIETVKKMEKEMGETGYWKIDAQYPTSLREDVNEDDDLQKVSYDFDCRLYNHIVTLNYEPLSKDSDIPAYTQKCICTLDPMPAFISLGESAKIGISAEYVGKNEYAGLIDSYWIYSDDERVKIINDDGYIKGQAFVGDGDAGSKDSLKTSFTISFPDEVKDGEDEFYIYFESCCGKSAFKYKWENY